MDNVDLADHPAAVALRAKIQARRDRYTGFAKVYLALAEAGWTMVAIAATVGCADSIVFKLVDHAGLVWPYERGQERHATPLELLPVQLQAQVAEIRAHYAAPEARRGGRPRLLLLEDLAEVQALYDIAGSGRAVARALGVSAPRVYEILRGR